ncbi:MAG: DoxX family membrane protein [Acidobacteriota bacterium]|nr:MAG: DoxX family membrane protein [Acidobacteriota bacterium]
MSSWLDCKWLHLACRVVLACVFVYASLHKISDPAAFAQNIQNYRMMPLWSTNLLAIYLPWLELLAGIFLLVGFWIRASAVALAGLSGLFIVGLTQAVVRGIELHCGCFSSAGEASGTGEMLLHIAGNAGLLAMGALLVARTRSAPEG